MPSSPAPAPEVVEQQGARIPAEWLLQLGGLLCSRAGPSGDLGIAVVWCTVDPIAFVVPVGAAAAIGAAAIANAAAPAASSVRQPAALTRAR